MEQVGKDHSSTPYDDVFRTMVHRCSRFLIPLINEVFGKHYTSHAKVQLLQNEHFKNKGKGKQEEIISDSNIAIEEPELGLEQERYHFECQSTEDKGIVVRMFEYGSQMAIKDSKIVDGVLTVKFPNAAVLYLRANTTIPDVLKVRMETLGGVLEYEIPTIRLWEFDLEEIFEKELYFLLPFYLFNYEKKFEEYQKDEKKLQELAETYSYIDTKLNQLRQTGKITDIEEGFLGEMSNKVAQHLASKYEKVRKEVEEIMTGTILRTPITDAYDKGREDGVKQSVALLNRVLSDKNTAMEMVAEQYGIAIERVQEILDS